MNPDKHTWDLLVGALKSTLRDDEQRAFDQWAAEAENRRFYNNLTHAWREIQQRAATYEPDRDRLWQQLQQSHMQYIASLPRIIWKTLRMILTMISMMTSSMTKIRYRFRTTKQVSKKQAEMPAFLQDEVDDGWTVLCSVD